MEHDVRREGKQRTLTMVQAIEAGHGARHRIARLDDAATKKQALDKLHAIVNKIGYPGQVARLFVG